MSEINDVRAFLEKFSMITSDVPTHLTKRKLAERANFMLEELNEFIDSAGLRVNRHDNCVPSASPQNLAGQADALVDLVYVALGTAVMLGLPWEALWRDVQEANMRKQAGPTARMPRGDAVKPFGWEGPDPSGILRAHGYDPANFADIDGNVAEHLCKDDVV